MQGYETLWMPGTDHAGIATQTRVEKELAKEKLTRHSIGREKFIERVWEWADKHKYIILKQLRKLGCSADWDRTAFTLDEGLSNAVTEVFVKLYEKGLIYRGEYIINWCPECMTALSDEEAIHQEQQGNIWYIKYPIKGSNDFITVATTRPETMLGDTAVAVNPDDERYKNMVGKTAILPIMEREIPIISDEYVDKEFGTGAVKVTPAHDPNDFQMGIRHNLPRINIMNKDATLNKNAGKYTGKDRFIARKEIVKELEEKGLIEKVEKHNYSLARCQRSDTIIEPYVSKQWFVKMKPLSEPALRVVLDGKIKFYPEKWIKTYQHWMDNIRDWCISRQLWWGHRIPAYYCKNCKEITVSKDVITQCKKCNSENIYQDEDVLDTWFSSWLWPFSTMGWPEKTEEQKYFYPTNDLVTAPDIIFFWVARMIVAGLEFKGDIPFRNVYFTGLIRDEIGRKMSKSLGNSPDPLVLIDKYGSDALRYGIMLIAPQGQDILFSEERLEVGRNFMNKIWNASRFIMMNFAENNIEVKPNTENLSDKWILSRLNRTIIAVDSELKNFRFNETAKVIYDFAWHDFCDWYVEMIKERLYSENIEEKNKTLGTAIYVMDKLLKLLHPFAPFITEEIWQQFKKSIHNFAKEESIMISIWPKADESMINEKIENEMNFIQEVIGAIRNIRSEMNVPPSKKASVIIKSDDESKTKILMDNQNQIFNLAKVDKIDFGKDIQKPKASASSIVKGIEIFVPLEGLIDITVEKNRLTKEINRLEQQIISIDRKLMNEEFVKKAPKEVIDKEKQKRKDYSTSLEKLKENFKNLS
jgi:valyl-tRNA synthetase